MGIQDFFDDKTKEKSKVTNRTVRYQNESQGMTEPEKRELEMELLTPEKIPDYIGETTICDVEHPDRKQAPIASMSVKLVFPGQESLDLFSKHFKVSQRIEASLLEMSKLLAVVQLLEDGKVIYDSKTNKASVKA